MVDLLQNVLGDVTGGVLTDRVKHHLSRIQNPQQHLEPEHTNELLIQIRDAMYAVIGATSPPLYRLRLVVPLGNFPNAPYIIQYEGRPHCNMLSGVAFNLYVESVIGRFTKPIPIGWTNLDLPDGSRIYTVAGDPVQNVQIEYANYIHGISM